MEYCYRMVQQSGACGSGLSSRLRRGGGAGDTNDAGWIFERDGGAVEGGKRAMPTVRANLLMLHEALRGRGDHSRAIDNAINIRNLSLQVEANRLAIIF